MGIGGRAWWVLFGCLQVQVVDVEPISRGIVADAGGRVSHLWSSEEQDE